MEPTLQQTGVLRALEEVAKTREAADDWDFNVGCLRPDQPDPRRHQQQC
jgi:hypothetical protein